MKPYYQDENATIYHGDCREVAAELWFGVDLLLTDPPYGISERCDRKGRKRGALAECNDFPPIFGDDGEFDPEPWLSFPKVVLFGANHYAHKLPPSASWVVWDKRDGLMSKRGDAFNDNGDAEMAWTNLGGPVRVISHRWMGMLKASERTEKRVHPTQKPVAVMRRLITDARAISGTVMDPFMGSGSTLLAASQLKTQAIGIEIDERYCEIAANRLANAPLTLEAV